MLVKISFHFYILLILMSNVLNQVQLHSYDTPSVSKAISDVIQEFYIKNQIQFDFLIYGKPTNHINDVTDEVIKNLNGKIPNKIFLITNTSLWFHNFFQSAVIFLPTINDLTYLHAEHAYEVRKNLLLRNKSFKKLKFLIYCEDIKNIANLVKVMAKHVDRVDIRNPDI
ncbi:hypothetical protein PVAND_014822 [Polypedilum vanderplanki]|uniref:Ionotropic receptor n=1 Tax=Polypedilum vanderplanki TaxID=319348 RepID=A0A9J6BAH6_POLVA|nr:hypothetical protein PVAND_014822 [Polypedilum vanderplanki]